MAESLNGCDWDNQLQFYKSLSWLSCRKDEFRQSCHDKSWRINRTRQIGGVIGFREFVALMRPRLFNIAHTERNAEYFVSSHYWRDFG